MYEPFSKVIQLGDWSFSEIDIKDKNLYNSYMQKTNYPCNLWSCNFAYLWAISQSSARKVLWKIINEMLVTFFYSYKGSLYLACLPLGMGDAEKVISVCSVCLNYCLNFNKNDYDKSSIKMINEAQLEFLKKSPQFDKHFKTTMWQGIERHYDIDKLTKIAGKDFANVRNRVNKFHKENPNAEVLRYEQSDYDALIKIDAKWKATFGKKYANIFDGVYYKELIKHFEQLEQIILVIKLNDEIVGMVAGGLLPNNLAWGSVVKFEPDIQGLSETLIVEFAKEINRIDPNTRHFNVGSDLGAGGLREYKLKFNPVLNLRRYQIFLRK